MSTASLIAAQPGVRLFVQDIGSGSPVVLVAGFGLTHALWDRQVRILAHAGHRVIAIDLRGHGKSDKPLDAYRVVDLAADLAAVLDSQDIHDATVVGHSFGGQVCFALAAERPDLVARLVLVSSNAVRTTRSNEFPFGSRAEDLLPGLLEGEEGDRIRARRQTLASAFATPPTDGTIEWLLAMSLEMPSWVGTACYRSLMKTDLTAYVTRVRQPVLQIAGTSDPVLSTRGAKWLNERLADAQLVTIPDCGHYPMLEAADTFDRALLDFSR